MTIPACAPRATAQRIYTLKTLSHLELMQSMQLSRSLWCLTSSSVLTPDLQHSKTLTQRIFYAPLHLCLFPFNSTCFSETNVRFGLKAPRISNSERVLPVLPMKPRAFRRSLLRFAHHHPLGHRGRLRTIREHHLDSGAARAALRPAKRGSALSGGRKPGLSCLGLWN